MSGDELGKLRRTCEVCEGPLQHPKGPGRPRRYCGKKCAHAAHLEQRRDQYDLLAAEHVSHAEFQEWCSICRFNRKRRLPGPGVAVCNTRPSTVISDQPGA